MSTIEVPFRLVGNTILLRVKINDVETEMILDTGDAIGPVLGPAQAQHATVLSSGGRFNVSGAGGTSQVFMAHMNIGLGGEVFRDEVGAIDLNLQGHGLLGLPFFLAKTDVMALDFRNGILTLEAKGTGPETCGAEAHGEPEDTVRPVDGEALLPQEPERPAEVPHETADGAPVDAPAEPAEAADEPGAEAA